MELGTRVVKIEDEGLRQYFDSISQAQKELEKEGYYVRVGDRLIDPKGDIYTDNHPVMKRAMEIYERSRPKSKRFKSYPCPCGEIPIESPKNQWKLGCVQYILCEGLGYLCGFISVL